MPHKKRYKHQIQDSWITMKVNVLGKYKKIYGTEAEITYTCPYCGESVTETICFSNEIGKCIAEVDSHKCPECGEENDLSVDLY